ncbi:M23 family metallopeptidase [Rhodococcus sp. D2-41]|uniref:murein hydrolase activator EnvC family protein n=1 Tax=Speluncibacter jeojiensis TaxID=2710754 RepID=UPI003853F579|nr:M23 family metallopeptidase [Rhodococcus sp. D2-41]
MAVAEAIMASALVAAWALMPPAAAPTALPAPAAPAATATSTNAKVSVDSTRAGAYVWPLTPRPEITRRFDRPMFRYGRGHRGVDLAAPPGGIVRAAGTGTVTFAGSVAGRGVVSIDHPGGLRTTYEPVEPSVHAGDTVRRASPIGTLATGHPGCPRPACLHWGLRRGGDYLDPLSLLGAVHVRLKPLTG